jgi:uncharacterized hydrophobic protein (TIGR00271 family)
MEESKFNFSENQDDSQNEKVEQTKENIKQEAKGLWRSISSFFVDFLDFRHDTDRTATIEAIKSDISFKGATAWILVCSIFVASVGLNADSTAVVIGAMLISPLMGPILGVGMSIAINDIDALRRSLINLGVMIVLSLLAATFFFWLFPLREETSELLGRTRPDIRDVLIAFFGGLALIIARTKKGTIASVIFGVAIATALMPPLCTAGYGIAIALKDDFLSGMGYAGGAMYLFTINAIFIALATFVVLKLLGFPMIKYANSKKRRRISRMAYIVAILVMIYPIFTFVKVLKESKINTQYAQFIKNEIENNEKLWLQKHVKDDDAKTIKLFFNGEVTDVTKGDLEKEKNSFDNLMDYEIIYYGDDSRSASRLSERLDRAYRDLDNKDNIIAGLQSKIDNLNTEIDNLKNKQSHSVDFETLSKDAKIKFNDLKYFSYGTALASGNFKDIDTVQQVYVKWNNALNDSIINIKDAELYDWLRVELKTESLILKH